MVAAGLRADTADLRTFLDVLAGKLVDALPGRVTVQYESGLFKKERRVQLVRVPLGGSTYQLRWTRDTVEATVDSGVVPLDTWLERLWAELQEQARTTAEGRTAMDQLISGRAPARQIARSPLEIGHILSLHPSQTIPPESTVVVADGETAVFVRAGAVLGQLGPGSWPVGEEAEPWLAAAADPSDGEFHCRLYFVARHELTNLPFGGRIDNVEDPETGLAVGLRVFGDYALQVLDPAALVLRLGAQSVMSDEELRDWMRERLLRVLRTDVVAHIAQSGWPILGLAAHADEIERETVERVNAGIAEYGLGVVRIGNFTISMQDEDEANLKRYRTELQMHRLGGAATTPVAGAASATRPALACPSCGAENPSEAKFCIACGKPLAAACGSCGYVNPAGSRFCGNCGRPLA
jgi:membrane protease subunit (stomatin/prohibitin family)